MPKFFIPARNSRHRTACFALYKALVQRARRVPLPEHVAYRVPDKPYVHPIQRFIRHSFQQNRGDTSPRLVLAALNNGYKFLDLLAEAQTPTSQAHKSIVAFLEKTRPPKRPPPPLRAKQKRHDRRAVRLGMESLESAESAESAGSAGLAGPAVDPTPRRPSLITRRAIPGSEKLSADGTVLTYMYEYVPTEGARPLSELPGGVEHGRRRVPKLTTDASGIPFLRMSKPQSPILSRVLRLKGRKRRDRAQLASELMRHEMDFAAQEDTWEANLARALTEEAGVTGATSAATAHFQEVAREPTYRSSVAVAVAYLNAQLNTETADMLSRAKAYLQIVDRERDLAEQEEKERQERLLLGKQQQQQLLLEEK